MFTFRKATGVFTMRNIACVVCVYIKRKKERSNRSIRDFYF